MLLLAAILGAIGYHYLSNADYRRELVQKAEEAREVLKEDKKGVPWTGTAVVAEVVKGDRAKVDLEASRKVLVRLAGIDAPELPKDRYHKGQPLAEQSRDYLLKLIQGKAVEMAIVGTDAAKTPLVLLTLEGVLINAKMVEAGFAEMTAETSEAIPAKQRHAIENAELSAKKGRLGIWGLTNYVRPVEFRIRQSNNVM
jgi:endonuclease YncB( thermonuclease family)